MRYAVQQFNVLASFGARLIIFPLLGLFLNAEVAADARSVETSLDEAYGPNGQERADLCLPRDDSAAHPGVVMIHGGGWAGGDKKPYAEMCKAFAERGIAAVAINYRLAAPDARWPTQLADAQLAVRWFKSLATKFRLDPHRVCALGDSAGAHISLELAVTANTVSDELARLHKDISSMVACVIDNFGPSDFTKEFPYRESLRKLFDTTTPLQDGHLEESVSPIFNLSQSTPPLFVAQGDTDQQVPAEHAAALVAKAQSLGIRVQYVTYHGGHEWEG